MDRTIYYEKDLICDICGKKGAFDFMGDILCEDCIKESNNTCNCDKQCNCSDKKENKCCEENCNCKSKQ